MSGHEQQVILECSLRYAEHDEDGRAVAEGEARARLTEEHLALLPSLGEALLFTLREISSMSSADYRLTLSLASCETLTLSHLGRHHDDFVRVLTRLRNEIIIKDLLMHESLLSTGIEARYSRVPAGGEETGGRCEIRLYETGVVIIPEEAGIERIPYSFISALGDGDHSLAVEIEGGDRFLFSHLGRKLDHLRTSLSGALSELALNTQHRLQELIPDIDPPALRRSSRLLKDGRAARRMDLEAISPHIWRGLEEHLEAVGMGAEYGFLKGLSQEDRVCIGFKRGLLGDLTGEYVWFLVPIYGMDPEQPGNAVAMEAVSSTGGGRATYFFRITGRENYRRLQLGGDADALHREAGDFVRDMNRCMLAINFRREPIYLPDERLREPRYARYRIAVEKIPELRLLRHHFIGRVVHHSLEQWQRDAVDLLRFNATAGDDSARWRKGDAAPEGEDIDDS